MLCTRKIFPSWMTWGASSAELFFSYSLSVLKQIRILLKINNFDLLFQISILNIWTSFFSSVSTPPPGPLRLLFLFGIRYYYFALECWVFTLSINLPLAWPSFWRLEEEKLSLEINTGCIVVTLSGLQIPPKQTCVCTRNHSFITDEVHTRSPSTVWKTGSLESGCPGCRKTDGAESWKHEKHKTKIKSVLDSQLSVLSPNLKRLFECAWRKAFGCSYYC